MDIVKLVEVLSAFGVGRSGRVPFRFRSRLRRCIAVVDFTSIECALDCGVRGEDGLTEPRVHKRVQRRRRASGGSSPSLPSVSMASMVAALREECARSLVEPSEEGVLADMPTAALEASGRLTGELSNTVGLALLRS